jgi:allantoicase
VVHGVDVDTTHFTGNFPAECSVDGCSIPGYPDVADLTRGSPIWRPLLGRTALRGDTSNLLRISSDSRCTHLRLNIFPDGGVARLRVYGVPVPDWDRLDSLGCDLDLAAAEHGGLVVACSDMFFGARHNLIMPGPPFGMNDGWETRRRRGPGHDWVVLKLARSGRIRRIEVDTTHFKGNAPARCSLEVCEATAETIDEEADGPIEWIPLLDETPLQPDTRHEFVDEVLDPGRATHVRFNIFPDGGVGRLRLWGR